MDPARIPLSELSGIRRFVSVDIGTAARSDDSFGLGLCRLFGGGFDDGFEFDGCQSAEGGLSASAVVGAFDLDHDSDPEFVACQHIETQLGTCRCRFCSRSPNTRLRLCAYVVERGEVLPSPNV